MRPGEAKKRLAESSVDMVSISYSDLAGVTRSKPAVRSNLDALLKNGAKTARANLDMNHLTPLTPGSKLDISQGDVSIVPDPETLVFPSYSPETARMIGWVHEADGRLSALCTRGVLVRALERVRGEGYDVTVGLESEFHLVEFREGRPVPADRSGIQTQGGFDQHREFLGDVVSTLRSVGVSPVKAHVEGGKGQLEVDLAPEGAMKAADGFVYFKDVVKAVARRHRLTASFMPKIGADWWGSGLHVHFSLKDRRGRNAFADGADPNRLGLSRICYQFIGGILESIPALCAVAAPTVNSYKRLLPGRWNADAVAYGPGNRGAALRIPDERGEATRVELRIPDNTCNVYLMLACAVAAGLAGMQKKADPGPPLTFDASKMTDRELVSKGLRLLPRSLGEAIGELQREGVLKKALGTELLEEYITQRSFEVSQAADQVTEWEVSHFLDLF
ncbi:MAG: glutamine synthetase [Thaumarchaeota archaeon]|nr:glutamine synthetase [Nitrososphaerota archaeon]